MSTHRDWKPVPQELDDGSRALRRYSVFMRWTFRPTTEAIQAYGGWGKIEGAGEGYVYVDYVGCPGEIDHEQIVIQCGLHVVDRLRERLAEAGIDWRERYVTYGWEWCQLLEGRKLAPPVAAKSE